MSFLNSLKQFGFLRRAFGILLGSILFGIGYSWFLIPFKIAPGGVGGISGILFHLFDAPLGITMLAINIPLWIIGILLVNRQFGYGTFIGFFTSSIMTELLSPEKLYNLNIMRSIIIQYNTIGQEMKPTAEWAMTDNIFLACIAGSILLGAGLGIIFRSNASTGGTDIPVAMLKKYFNISIGNGYIIVETLIIFLIGFVFADMNLIIWGYFGLFLTTRFSNIITEGLPNLKAAIIISNNDEYIEEIRKKIYNELNRGVTYLKGYGTYEKQDKNIIFVVFNIRQQIRLYQLVKEIDPHVFMVIADVYDIMGYGFKSTKLTIE